MFHISMKWHIDLLHKKPFFDFLKMKMTPIFLGMFENALFYSEYQSISHHGTGKQRIFYITNDNTF